MLSPSPKSRKTLSLEASPADFDRHTLSEALLMQAGDIQRHLMSLLAGLIGQAIPADQPFMEAGLDSLGAVELRNGLASKYGMDLPASLLFDYPSVASLSSYLADILQPSSASTREGQSVALLSSVPEHSGVDVVGLACQYPHKLAGGVLATITMLAKIQAAPPTTAYFDPLPFVAYA